MIHFIGTTHAARILKEAAHIVGLPLTDNMNEADLVFVSEDMPTDSAGNRHLGCIMALLRAVPIIGPVVVLTSQVPPGFTRSLNRPIYYMAETLRIKDALHRALMPEQFIVGCYDHSPLSLRFQEYVDAFPTAVVHRMTYEEAEFAKIAINMFLAAEVDATNRLSKAAAKVNASWSVISQALKSDKRIGPHAYLTPGHWEDSPHLLRDAVTLAEIEAR